MLASRAFGDIFARSSWKFLAMFRPFFLNRLQVTPEDPVRHWNMDLIPAVIAGFVASEQQNGGSPRIKSV
jgi:hypothetical protein